MFAITGQDLTAEGKKALEFRDKVAVALWEHTQESMNELLELAKKFDDVYVMKTARLAVGALGSAIKTRERTPTDDSTYIILAQIASDYANTVVIMERENNLRDV